MLLVILKTDHAIAFVVLSKIV